MAIIRQCLTPSNGIKLVNSMINGTANQENLVQWKNIYSNNSFGTVGSGYWWVFLEYNRYLIYSKNRGTTCELGVQCESGRESWSTYTHFADVNSHIIDDMVDTKLVVKLDMPVWKDREGYICQEEDALGCNVTRNMLRPGMHIVRDEVGGNISVRGDGHTYGELDLETKGTIPHKKYQTKTNTLP